MSDNRKEAVLGKLRDVWMRSEHPLEVMTRLLEPGDVLVRTTDPIEGRDSIEVHLHNYGWSAAELSALQTAIQSELEPLMVDQLISKVRLVPPRMPAGIRRNLRAQARWRRMTDRQRGLHQRLAQGEDRGRIWGPRATNLSPRTRR